MNPGPVTDSGAERKILSPSFDEAETSDHERHAGVSAIFDFN